MANYHLNVKTLSRKSKQGAVRSVVSAAAYHAGEKLKDERLGRVWDYTKKQRPWMTKILPPPNAPDWVRQREQLWNEVEAAEKRVDSRLARTLRIALPAELSLLQQAELVTGFINEQVVALGMVADIAMYEPPKAGDLRNFYSQVMLTTRTIGSEGFEKKNRDWDSKQLLRNWREQWAIHVNRALEAAGNQARVDHRSLEAQGSERISTTHRGPSKKQKTAKATKNPFVKGYVSHENHARLKEFMGEEGLAESKAIDKLIGL